MKSSSKETTWSPRGITQLHKNHESMHPLQVPQASYWSNNMEYSLIHSLFFYIFCPVKSSHANPTLSYVQHTSRELSEFPLIPKNTVLDVNKQDSLTFQSSTDTQMLKGVPQKVTI